MSNTLMSAHRLHIGFFGCGHAALIDGGTHRSGIGFMQMADQQRPEINRLHTSGEGLESEALSDEGFADKSFSAQPSYFPIAAHLPLWPLGWITQGVLVPRHPFGAFQIPVCVYFLPQGFMRSDLVIVLYPSRGAMLLAPPGVCGWLDGFGFEDPVHLFMRAIFFRMPGPDEL